MKFRIISNPRKEWAGELAEQVGSFLAGHGHQAVQGDADATICIGGDGTVLYAQHQGRIQGPVLGIGTRKSYICQLERNAWKENVLAVLSGKTVPIMTIRASVDGKTYSALNDFVIHARDYRVIGLTVSCNGNEIRFRGDGIIASSALGSAAYAYSAGGEQLAPLAREISIVPIAPYRRAFQSLVLPTDSRIAITSDEPFAFIIDGILVAELPGGQKVNIEKGDDILFFEGVGFYR